MQPDPSNDKSPTPATNPSPKASPGGALHSLVEVEKLIQIAMLVPSGTIIGWLAGVGLDRWLHQTWIYIAGLLLGAAAGFVQMFRLVLQNTKE